MMTGGGGGGDGKIGIRRPSFILTAAGGDSPAVICYNKGAVAMRHSTINTNMKSVGDHNFQR